LEATLGVGFKSVVLKKKLYLKNKGFDIKKIWCSSSLKGRKFGLNVFAGCDALRIGKILKGLFCFDNTNPGVNF
jgi:hypothetical protein